MTPLLTVAQTTTYELTPASNRLSPLFWSGFTALNTVHGLWRWYRRYELYSKPDTLGQLLAGHLLNLTLGDVVILRVAAQCLLIATRIMECAKQQAVLCNSARKCWKSAFQGYYPQPIKQKWVSRAKSHWFSPSTIGWLQTRGQAFCNRISRIIECTYKVFFHCFKLSLQLMDVMDVICLSPYTQNEGITEIFVNTVKCLDTLVNNKEELLSGLESNKPIIEKILCNSPITYDRLHSTISQTLEKSETFYDTAKAVSHATGGFFTYAFNRIATSGRVFIGI
jgi:hypothetical protein